MCALHTLPGLHSAAREDREAVADAFQPLPVPQLRGPRHHAVLDADVGTRRPAEGVAGVAGGRHSTRGPRRARPAAEEALGRAQLLLHVVGAAPDVQPRVVKVADLDAGRTEVLDGLSIGEKVILSSSQPLYDGAVVEPAAS